MSVYHLDKRQGSHRRTTSIRSRLLFGFLSMIVIAAGIATLAHAKPWDRTDHKANVPNNAVNPLHDAKLFVDHNSRAAKQAETWQNNQYATAADMQKLASLPTAKWLTSAEALTSLDSYMQQATQQQAVPVLVSYNMPLRDCSLYSTGGAKDANDYKKFIRSLADKIGSNQSVVILEPDALAGMYASGTDGQPCLNDNERSMYYDLLRYAVDRLKNLPSTTVYIDAGHSAWITNVYEMVDHLQKANVALADGFSLNVSNFQTTADNTRYGTELSKLLDGKHFVIDTSRNGQGPYANPTHPDQNWCNPPGRALGFNPTTNTGNALIDAYLFIKTPGESDGADPDPEKCFGGPVAGAWWPEYALGLAQRQ